MKLYVKFFFIDLEGLYKTSIVTYDFQCYGCKHKILNK